MNISKDLPRFFLFALIAGLVLILLKQWVGFSSDYDAYEVIGMNVKGTDNNQYLSMKVITSGGAQASSMSSILPGWNVSSSGSTSETNYSKGGNRFYLHNNDEIKNLLIKQRCSICDTSMDNYLIDENRKLHVCAKSPDCNGHAVEEGLFKIRGYDGPTLECHKCGSEMQLKTGRFGKYFGCLNDNCGTTRALQRNGEPKPLTMEPISIPDLMIKPATRKPAMGSNKEKPKIAPKIPISAAMDEMASVL